MNESRTYFPVKPIPDKHSDKYWVAGKYVFKYPDGDRAEYVTLLDSTGNWSLLGGYIEPELESFIKKVENAACRDIETALVAELIELVKVVPDYVDKSIDLLHRYKGSKLYMDTKEDFLIL